MFDYDIQIKKFTVENFRSLKKVELVLNDRGYYSLAGKNGSGKTAILEAINIALSGSSSKFNKIRESDFYSEQPIKFTVEFNNEFLLTVEDRNWERLFPCRKFTKIIKRRKSKEAGEFFSSPFVISTNYEIEEFQRETPKTYTERFASFNKELSKSQFVVWSVEKKRPPRGEQAGFAYTIQNGQENWVNEREFPFANKLFFPKVFYFDKKRERELLPKYNTAFSSVVNELDWRFRRRFSDPTKEKEVEARQELREKYEDLVESINSQPMFPKNGGSTVILEPAMEILNKHFRLDYDFQKLNFYHFSIQEPFSNSFFADESINQNLLKSQNWGSGVSILVALAVLVSFAKESKNPIILLIDEPELHLHSDLQKNLSEFLKWSKFQALVATHSALFLDKVNFSNNLTVQKDSHATSALSQCNQLTLATTTFDLLGNSLDDLYIPEQLVLVEGKYDQKIISRCLELQNATDTKLLIMPCGGKDEVRNKAEALEEFFKKHLAGESWYSRYIRDGFRVLVDGDVSKDTVNGWKTTFNLTDEMILHLDENHKGIEYTYPSDLVKELVSGKILKNDRDFDSLDADEIVEIILSDEKIRSRSDRKNEAQQNLEEIVSKQRLTEYVSKNITKELLGQPQSANLKAIIDWIEKSV